MDKRLKTMAPETDYPREYYVICCYSGTRLHSRNNYDFLNIFPK